MAIHVTQHAIDRYRERVANVPEDEARSRLMSPRILRAVQFAGLAQCYIRLAGNFRPLVRDGCVVTVLPAENYIRHIGRVGRGRFG